MAILNHEPLSYLRQESSTSSTNFQRIRHIPWCYISRSIRNHALPLNINLHFFPCWVTIETSYSSVHWNKLRFAESIIICNVWNPPPFESLFKAETKGILVVCSYLLPRKQRSGAWIEVPEWNQFMFWNLAPTKKKCQFPIVNSQSLRKFKDLRQSRNNDICKLEIIAKGEPGSS